MTDSTIHPRERDLYRERDALRAEVERLRLIAACYIEQEKEVERLQLALEEIREAANAGADCTPLWYIADQALARSMRA